LRLFQQVLRAVQYAHGNLVIHRDLKPSNVIVGHDGRAMLLDFGIAKLIAAETADDNPRTQAGAAAPALTPEYASPEQISGPPITTASDIYSLGVLLFELLTGGCPYRLGRTTRAALEEAILTLDPHRPSQSVLAAAAARARASTVSGLSKALRGDLDTIVLKAMKKLPADRYSTADALSEDIERYLAGEPITARKDRGWYHTSKFISRHRISFIGAGVALAAVFATAAIAISQARSAAIHAGAAAAERDRALAFSARNAAAAEFLHILITEAARSNKPIAAADLVTRSETIVNKEYPDSPEDRAAVLDVLSGYYWSLVSHGAGNPRAALALLDQTLRLAAENEPDAPPEPTFLYNRAVLLEDLGRYRESRDTYLRCTAESRRTGAAQITAACFVGLASVSQELADPVSASGYLAAASANLDPAASPGSNAMIRLRIVKGSIALTAGRLEEARADLEAVIAASKNVYRTMRALLIRAELNLNVGMETAAEADARRVLELARTAQGSAAYSNYTGRSWLILGRVLQRRGDQVGAGKAFQAAVENLSNTVDADHPKLLLARHLADGGR
jgi:tetratricopeptide (TPR) repeat protein